jgi:hypothetical protein
VNDTKLVYAVFILLPGPTVRGPCRHRSPSKFALFTVSRLINNFDEAGIALL